MSRSTGVRAYRWIAGLALGSVLLAACATSGGPESEGDGATQPPGEGTEPAPLIDPGEIISGGPPPDGIPPIDDPKFQDPAGVDWLAPKEPVLAVEINGDARAYPAQILIWHEIVNDTVGGVPVAVTYCPLCNTGVAFERPTIDGQLLDFGTSGKLYRSNLVMYDRQTESYWPQVTGQAAVGPLTGEQLEFVPVQLVAWQDWLAVHPEGKVLSRDTGASRSYGSNPYQGYDEENTRPFLYEGEIDPRLPPKARVVGVTIGEESLAFPYQELRSRASGDWAAVVEPLGDRTVLVLWKAGTLSAVDQGLIAESQDVGATGTFDPVLDGAELTFTATPAGVVDDQTGSTWDIFGRAVAGPMEGEQLNRVISVESFWFDWAGFHPQTEVFGGGTGGSASALGAPTGVPAGGGLEIPRRPKV